MSVSGQAETEISGRGRFGQADVVLVLLIVVVVAGAWTSGAITSPALHTWCTVFVAIVLQATPFVALGVVLAATISVVVSEPMLRRILPARPALAVPAAGLAGIALPGCECASVPIAASLVRGGAAPAAAFTFLLAGPAINPVVLVATAMAFPGRPEMVLARFTASLLVSIVVGWLWAWRGSTVPLRLLPRRHGHGPQEGRFGAFVGEARHEFVHTAGFLVLGAAVAATVNTLLPRAWVESVAAHHVLAVLVLAAFAVVVAMCSEADAFVAASLTMFSDVARLAFLVVGPAVDVKLVTMHAGYFGRRFALVFGPLTFLVALTCAVVVGTVLL